jgi:hypothetical protein
MASRSHRITLQMSVEPCIALAALLYLLKSPLHQFHPRPAITTQLPSDILHIISINLSRENKSRLLTTPLLTYLRALLLLLLLVRWNELDEALPN